jgi:hypothetical protein
LLESETAMKGLVPHPRAFQLLKLLLQLERAHPRPDLRAHAWLQRSEE